MNDARVSTASLEGMGFMRNFKMSVSSTTKYLFIIQAMNHNCMYLAFHPTSSLTLWTRILLEKVEVALVLYLILGLMSISNE